MKTDTKFNQLLSHNFTLQAGRVRRAGLALTLGILGFLSTARGQDPNPNPAYPMDTNVSLGATIKLQVYATTAYWPLAIQWQHAGTNLPGATGVLLTIANVSAAHAGSYMAWVTNAIGDYANTRTATVTIDPTFVKITSGAIVTDREASVAGAWCDYDGDGYLDLFVSHWNAGGVLWGNGPASKNSLYHNNGDGTFTKITTNALSETAGWWTSGSWADLDNDGDPDLYVPGVYGNQPIFYRNDGNGRFTAVSIDPTRDLVARYSEYVAWGDYDQDGWVDLFMPLQGGSTSNRLFRNLGDLNFNPMAAAEVGDLLAAKDPSGAVMAYWIDYDDDGDQDIYVWENKQLSLYLNSGTGFFTQTFSGSIANVPEVGWGGRIPMWADYDNDGYPDVFIVQPGDVNALHHNLGGTSSVQVTQVVLDEPMNSVTAAWGDYDNDGDLDLFVVNNPKWGTPPVWRGANVLYQNNGDGMFTEVDVGSPIWEASNDWDCNWIDYDNDGFLDLFIAAGYPSTEVNYLYRNNLLAIGNTNHWLKVSLVGKASNASGIGAKVRVTANIRGQTVTQLRPIESTASFGRIQGLLAHFGLGDATAVTTLRIEWPSGIVQELPNVVANQFLTVVESQGYTGIRPSLLGATNDPSGLQLSFTEPAAKASYTIEASTNLVDWTKLVARTSLGVVTNFTDLQATNYTKRFYRILVP